MGDPRKSYDEKQLEAVLVQCSQCQTWYYTTTPQTPEICYRCRAAMRPRA